MDFLRQQIGRIQQQLNGLNATQRMLAAALVVIMVMTIYWWTNYAGRAEMEPVLDQALKHDEIAVITGRLRALGIPFQVVNDRVQVPAERRTEAQADLSFMQLTPQDTTAAVNAIVSKSSFWTSSQEREKIWNEARQATLAQWIRRWPGVASAAVIIDPARQQGFLRVEPSASVDIGMQPGKEGSRKMVEAAARTVAGAVSGLSRSQVNVTVDGKPQSVSDPANPLAGVGDEWLERIRNEESYYRNEVLAQLSWIRGALVSVRVDVNLKQVEQTHHGVDPKKSVEREREEEITSEQNRSGAAPAAEAGTMANVPWAGSAASTGESTDGTIEKTRNRTSRDYEKTETHTTHRGGDSAVVSASVLLPRSHFVNTYKALNRLTDREPDVAVVDQFIQAELGRLKPGIIACLHLKNDSAVHVETYTDLLPTIPASPQVASTGSFSLALTDHAKEITLGALALISLFMVSHMVKRGTPAPAVVPAPPPRSRPTLSVPDEAVGEAIEGDPLLDGMELDEDSVKAQQMLNQVAQLVEENPDAAAGLVKRWLNRS